MLGVQLRTRALPLLPSRTSHSRIFPYALHSTAEPGLSISTRLRSHRSLRHAKSQLVPSMSSRPPHWTSRSLSTSIASTSAANVTAAGEASVPAARVVVITTRACPYCKAAKEALRQAGIAHANVDVSSAPDLMAKVRDITGSRTVPQIFVSGSSIGGSDTLAKMLADGTFQSLVEAASGPALPVPILNAWQEMEGTQGTAAAAPSGPSQELLQLAQDMGHETKGVLRSDIVLGGRALRSFTGRQAVGWFMSQQQGGSRESAVQLGQQLLQGNLMSVCAAGPAPPEPQPFADSTEMRYMLVADAPNPLPGQALNTHFWWYGSARPATQVATEVRALILDLYERHLSADGRAVSYQAIGRDPLFRRYVDATAELQRLDLSPLSPPELIALFINLYNALIVHGLVMFGTEMGSLQRVKFFASVKYNIGGYEYTADDMENGVLRGNRAAASNVWVLLGLPQFSGGQFHKKDDPRRRKVVQEVDPRIHFTLVCGAKSCPPIKLYTPDNLDEGLDAAGESFCAGEVEVDAAKRLVRISKIFKWYSVDFGSNQAERLTWIAQFLKGAARSDLESMLADGKGIKVEFKEYDWTVNSDEK